LFDQVSPDRIDLQRHLEICARCRFLLARLKEEYSELRDYWAGIQLPRVIYLAPMAVEDSLDGSQMLELAAEGVRAKDGAHGFTLASSDHQVFLRVIRDGATRETWLYVMSDNPHLIENVLVKSPFGGTEFVTDAKGRINLGIVDWPGNEPFSAEVRLPEEVFLLEVFTPIEAGESSILTSTTGTRIQILFHGVESGNRLEVKILETPGNRAASLMRMAVRLNAENELTVIRPIVSNRARFENLNPAEMLEIYIY